MQMMIKLTDSKFTRQGESYNRVWKEDHTWRWVLCGVIAGQQQSFEDVPGLYLDDEPKECTWPVGEWLRWTYLKNEIWMLTEQMI